jgi:hypothetical protein
MKDTLGGILIAALICAFLFTSFKLLLTISAPSTSPPRGAKVYRVLLRSETGEVRVYEHASNPFEYTDKHFTTSEGIQVQPLTGAIEAELETTAEKKP